MTHHSADLCTARTAQGIRPLISTMAPPVTSNQKNHDGSRTVATSLVLEPRRAVLRALRTWAADLAIDSGDLAALDRVLIALTAAEDGPDFDLAMRAARCSVVAQARQRRRKMAPADSRPARSGQVRTGNQLELIA